MTEEEFLAALPAPDDQARTVALESLADAERAFALDVRGFVTGELLDRDTTRRRYRGRLTAKGAARLAELQMENPA